MREDTERPDAVAPEDVEVDLSLDAPDGYSGVVGLDDGDGEA
jgi:hypothetical protein